MPRLEPFDLPESSVTRLPLLLVLVIMGGVGLLDLHTPAKIAAALALLAGLAVLFFLPARVFLPGRRIHLHLAAQALLVAGLLTLGANNGGFGFLMLVPAMEAALYLPTRPALAWVGGLYAIVAAHSWLAWRESGVINIFYNAAGFAFIVAMGYTVRQLELARRRSDQLYGELQAAQQQLRSLAVAEERTRLARELHDSLGHRLTVAVVQLEGAQRLIPRDPERAAGMIAAMRAQLKDALADLRRAVAALRADRPPLAAGLVHLAHDFSENTGLAVHLDLPPNLPPLPESVHLALYRAAQEALTNTQRHARATQAWLALRLEPGAIELSARDDGQGAGVPDPDSPDGPAPGFGLQGLQERAAELGGEFHFDPRPGEGARLSLRLPLAPEERP